MKLQSGRTIPPPPFTLLKSPQPEITLAVAQITNDVAAMITAVRQARAKKADVVVFPERAVAEAALERLQAAARDNHIAIVVGMEHRVEGGRRNSAFVSVLTARC